MSANQFLGIIMMTLGIAGVIFMIYGKWKASKDKDFRL